MGPWVLGVSTTAVVWLTVGLVTTLAMLAMVAALIRHALLIGRAVSRMNEELAPIMADIQRSTPATGVRPSPGRRRG